MQEQGLQEQGLTACSPSGLMLAYNRGVEGPEEPASLPHLGLSGRPEPRALGENDVRPNFLFKYTPLCRSQAGCAEDLKEELQ
jgi:hypothetical protein